VKRDDGRVFSIPMVLIAYHKWKTRRSRAYAMGMLIGVGIGLLLQGLCFVLVR
jgi:hypothetical protein